MIPVLIHLCINMLIAPPSCPVWGAVSPGIPHAGCSSAPEMKASRRCPVVSAQHPAHYTGDCCSMSSLLGAIHTGAGYRCQCNDQQCQQCMYWIQCRHYGKQILLASRKHKAAHRFYVHLSQSLNFIINSATCFHANK